MCTETGIKDVYRGVQGACPRRAVTHAGGTAERSERRAVGMGLKLVTYRRLVRCPKLENYMPKKNSEIIYVTGTTALAVRT